jgi:hypothetical protein
MDSESGSLRSCLRTALQSGAVGSAAMVLQVVSLMWLRTIINHQYRFGGTITSTTRLLYSEGGVRRFYRGIGPALLHAPLARFGDMAINSGTMQYLEHTQMTRDWPVFLKTMVVSSCASLYRVMIMPVDTLKSHFQVHGKQGLDILRNKVQNKGLRVFYHGATASITATYVAHYPWFVTFNYLSSRLPRVPKSERLQYYSRSAVIGFCSSILSDLVSNGFRVIKITRQTTRKGLSYPQVVRLVIRENGVVGFFTRGLRAKLLANGLQSIMFSVLWRHLTDKLN